MQLSVNIFIWGVRDLSLNTFNALICMDRKSGECKYIKSFEGNAMWSKGLHKK